MAAESMTIFWISFRRSQASARIRVSAEPTASTVQAVNSATDSGVVGDNVTSNNRPQIAGKAETNNLVTVYRNGASVGTVTADSSGSWSFLSSNLPDGQYAFRATATDLA